MSEAHTVAERKRLLIGRERIRRAAAGFWPEHINALKRVGLGLTMFAADDCGSLSLEKRARVREALYNRELVQRHPTAQRPVITRLGLRVLAFKGVELPREVSNEHHL
jgi:hypothetical protein